MTSTPTLTIRALARGDLDAVVAIDAATRTVTLKGGGGKDKGGIITTEAPIDASNVQLVVKVDGKEVVTRVGYERREVTKRRPDGSEYTATRSVRIARKTGKEI